MSTDAGPHADVTASAVLEGVGGAANVVSLVHCATRLRFVLGDPALADRAGIERTPGVLAVVESGGQFQVVVGDEVTEVYAAVEAACGSEPVSPAAGSGGPLSRVLDAVTGIFAPFVWTLAGAGLLKALVALAVTLHRLDPASPEYTVLNAAGDAVFTFLPALLALTTARRFGANEYTALALAGALLSPAITALAESGKPVSLFGIPLVTMSYAGSVLPLILAVWAQSRLERGLRRVLHASVRSFLTPLLTLVVMVPVTLLAIGPLADAVSKGAADATTWLFGLSPALAGALLGGFSHVLIFFGLHWGLFPVIANDLAQQGHSLLYGPMIAATSAQAAAVVAVLLKTRDRRLMRLAGPAALSGFLAGVTEPAVYGVTMPLKRPFVCACMAAAVGGGIASAGGSASTAFIMPGLLALPAFVDVGSFTMQLTGIGVAVALSFALTWVAGFEEPGPESAA
ncbi:PTS transporter subunit EIIC [Streptomyces sp. TRM66268-LWL]|uniref:PTS transporter subunit EIIC n=1 Tax=Streptomyces polyasparticus TaxID=2767826 RepID=A0ABR7SSN2_9ACTN|nr:PTS transporter subunit EIIC [Streptomyces polyasparticus]MBC9717521.1 PTS transporter subunit EIIC [Streptomyces polyasparticus]